MRGIRCYINEMEVSSGFIAWLLAIGMGLGEAAVSPTAPLVIATRTQVVDTIRLGKVGGVDKPIEELQSALWLDFHSGTTGKRAGPYLDLSLGYTGGPAYTAPSFENGYLSWRVGIGAARRLAAWYALGSGTLVATSGIEGRGPNGSWWQQGPSLSMTAGLRVMTGFHAPVQTSFWYTMVPVTWAKTFPGLHLERFGHRFRGTVSYRYISVGLQATVASLYSRDKLGKWRDLGEKSIALIVQWRPIRHGSGR
jgi:hypothetical protein